MTAKCDFSPAIYRSDFNLIWVVQSSLSKIFRFPRRANQLYQLARLTLDTRGGSRVVTNAGWDAVDAEALGAR
jgi:hypothetical protein